jgi:twinkle protein
MKHLLMEPINFEAYLADISFEECQVIKPADSFIDGVCELAQHGERLFGAKLPWSITHEATRIGDGKLSIWAGENGSGKSLILGQVLNGLMEQGRKVVIASLEMYPKQTLYRMICQAATCKAGESYCRKWLEAFTGKLWIYDQLDTVSMDRMLGMAHYAAHELGVKDIVIDSLTKCGVSRDDYAAQAKFVDRLQWCAKKWGVHIHLVCHMRKGDGGRTKGKGDIRGASEITDLADNVYILKRNKLKEHEMQKRDKGQEFDEKYIDQPDAVLSQQKNRDYGHEYEYGLYFDMSSGLYKTSEREYIKPIEV